MCSIFTLYCHLFLSLNKKHAICIALFFEMAFVWGKKENYFFNDIEFERSLQNIQYPDLF